MDHLQQPKVLAEDSWQVPFVARLDYKPEGPRKFREFLTTANIKFEDETADEIASFIQSWLYFGLLSEVLKTPVDRCRFESYSDVENKTLLTTIALKDLIPQLHPLEDDDDSDDEDFQSPPEYEVVSRLLDIAAVQWHLIDLMEISSTTPLPIILLSIRVLIDTLRYVCLGTPAMKLAPVMENDATSATVDFLTELMVAKRWCPFQAKYVLQSFSPVVVCYIALIRRDSRPLTTHDKCDGDRCVAFNVVKGEYKTGHVAEYCFPGCRESFISIPRHEMKDIINSNGIPLAILKRSPTGQISLGVKRASQKDAYVAFSHVWSDGLGNPESNSVPRCQLERLDEHLVKASTHVSNMSRGILMGLDTKRLKTFRPTKFFWLDTLCIPVKTHEDAQTPELDIAILKRKAINKIGAVFVGASRVIVLDSEMENFKQESADWNETITRFLFSAWMGRCWTFEEGALSQAPSVKCEDGSFDPTSKVDAWWAVGIYSTPTQISALKALWELWTGDVRKLLNTDTDGGQRTSREFDRRIERLLSVPLQNAITKAFIQDTLRKAKLNDADEVEQDYFDRFWTCWDALSKRDTSRQTDRLSILANLLDLNPFQLTELELPMLGLLRSLRGVPVSMLYNGRMNDWAKTEDKDRYYKFNNKWLPCYPTRTSLPRKQQMTWTDDGLELVAKLRYGRHYPPGVNALLLEPSLVHPCGSCDIICGSDSCYYRFRVQFIRQANESKLETVGVATSLLIDTDRFAIDRNLGAGFSIPGACLQVVDKTAEIIKKHIDHDPQDSDAENEPKVCLSTVYDCPIRISLVGKGEEISQENAIPCEVLKNWSLKLACHFPEGENIPPTRRRVNSQLLQTLILFVIPLPFYITGAASVYLFIFLALMSFSLLPIAAKLAVILVFLSRLLTALLNVTIYTDAIYLLAAVLYVCVKSNVSNLSRLDYAFIILAGIGHTGVMAWYLFYKYYLGLKLYKEWQDSFNPEWRSERDMEWTERMDRFISWLTRLVIRD